MRVGHLCAQAPDVERGLEQMLDGREALAPIAGREVGGDAVEHLLRRREVPGRLEHEEPIGCGWRTWSLRYVPTSSTPAFVRVSERKTRPSSSRIARQ